MTKREMNINWEAKGDFTSDTLPPHQIRPELLQADQAEGLDDVKDSLDFGGETDEPEMPRYTLPPVFWEEESQVAMDALNDEITAQVLLRLSENTRPTRVLMDQKVRARMGELLKWKYPDLTQEQIEALRWWHDDVLMVHLHMVVCSDAELFVPGAMPTR